MINFSAILTSFDGKPIHNSDTMQPLTLREACVTALMTDISGRSGEPEMRSGVQKWEAGKLASRLAGELSLTAEEITLLKERVGLLWSASVVLAAWPLLDPGLQP